jgi:hypothetical protein
MEKVEAQFQNGNEGEGHLGLYRRKTGPSPITVRNDGYIQKPGW